MDKSNGTVKKVVFCFFVKQGKYEVSSSAPGNALKDPEFLRA